MNVAKRGGSAPVRSRRGKRHTWRVPCHGEGRGGGGDEGGHRAGGHGRAPGRWVPSQLGPARMCRGRGVVRCRAPHGALAHGWREAAVSHAGTKALGRETPSRRQRMSPTGALSEQRGAGREINSGVSGCPGQGGAGGPPPRGASEVLRLPRDYCFSQKSPFFFRDS